MSGGAGGGMGFGPPMPPMRPPTPTPPMRPPTPTPPMRPMTPMPPTRPQTPTFGHVVGSVLNMPMSHAIGALKGGLGQSNPMAGAPTPPMRPSPQAAAPMPPSRPPNQMQIPAPSVGMQGRGGPNMVPYRDAIAGIESRGTGDYGAVNPKTGALGRYQVMPRNLPQWSQESLGHQVTPQQFIGSHEAQDKVFDKEFGGYLKRGSPADAASRWYTGKPLSGGGAAGKGYADKFNRNLGQQASGGRISGSMGDMPQAAKADTGALVQHHGGDINRAVDDAMTKQGENAFVNRQDLTDYMRTGGHNLDPQTNAYCAAFTGAALEHAGVPSSHSNVATSYLNWGSPVTGAAQRGDVLVMSRGHAAGETGGHVGIATGKTNSAGQIEMIAGNTGGIRKGRSVSTSFVDPKSVTARRYDQNAGTASGGSIAKPATAMNSGIAETDRGSADTGKNQSSSKRRGGASQGQGGQGGQDAPQSPDNPYPAQIGQMVSSQNEAASQGSAQGTQQAGERSAHLLDAPKITSPDQLAGMKDGSVFMAPDGKLRYKTAAPPDQGGGQPSDSGYG